MKVEIQINQDPEVVVMKALLQKIKLEQEAAQVVRKIHVQGNCVVFKQFISVLFNFFTFKFRSPSANSQKSYHSKKSRSR